MGPYLRVHRRRQPTAKTELAVLKMAMPTVRNLLDLETPVGDYACGNAGWRYCRLADGGKVCATAGRFRLPVAG